MIHIDFIRKRLNFLYSYFRFKELISAQFIAKLAIGLILTKILNLAYHCQKFLYFSRLKLHNFSMKVCISNLQIKYMYIPTHRFNEFSQIISVKK